MRSHASCIAILAAAAAFSAAFASEFNPVAHEPPAPPAATELAVIVQLRADAAGAGIAKLSSVAGRAAALGKRVRLEMDSGREISPRMLASRITLGGLTPAAALARLRADPAVEFAVPDHVRHAQDTTPTDTLYTNQWYLQDSQPSSVNATAAWDREKGSSGIVVAVLDTGVLYDHPDLGRGDAAGKLLPGYDFITGVAQANDGDSRDADPSDPGDWVNDADKTIPALSNCTVTGSSWHGTRVSGMIGALTNNSAGVAGLDWNSFILPVRVLGKCGGTDSDILAGMRWAAGIHVTGIPDNPTPARIINMSLGATGACEPSYRSVIEELTARKVLVVISAGNEGTMVSSPANCPGVAAVAALRHAGSKVGFSNLGPEVTLGAPGGNCVNVNGGPCLFSLDTTSNTGTTVPAAHTFTDQFSTNLGTSFSAPIVSGIAALMVSRNGNLSTRELLERLAEGARPFPAAVADAPAIQACHVPIDTSDVQLEQCLCTTTTCGAGMADAAASVTAAERPIAAVRLPLVVAAGQDVTLDASGSAAACGASIASYAWSVVDPAVNPPPITGADTASATLTGPAAGAIVLRVTVTDSLGRTDSADVQVQSPRATTDAPATAGTSACAAPVTSGPTPRPGAVTPPSPSPSGSGGGGGGGGSLDLFGLGVLLLLATAAHRQRLRRLSPRCIC